MTTSTQLARSKRSDVHRLEPLALELRGYLAGAKQSVDEEIRTYPTPIPRCDAQFNHLYEQRSRLASILERVDAALSRGAAPDILMNAIAGFTASPPLVEGGEEQDLRERLRAVLSGTR
jgi:hypothetical protein